MRLPSPIGSDVAESDPWHSLSDAEILRSVEYTLRDVLLPALPDEAEWPRTATVQLIGLVRYALRRGEDRTTARTDEVAEVLGRLRANDIVNASWDGTATQVAVMDAAGRALAAAVGRDDAAAAEVRAELRPVLLRQLDDELAETGPLVDAFRGKLDDH